MIMEIIKQPYDIGNLFDHIGDYDSKIIEKYGDPLQLKDWFIGQQMNTKLNRLKKSNPEAFFYWYKVFELEITTVVK